MSAPPRFSDGDGGETLADGTAVGLPGSHGERSRFDPGELRRVLDAFPLEGIREIREFPAGSRQAPKVRIVADEGEFLLKRRTVRPDLVERATFNHRLQLHLERRGVPVATLVGTREDNASILLEHGQVYEMFHWVDGRRMVKVESEALNAGRILGRLHLEACDLAWPEPPPMPGFHAADQVQTAFDRVIDAVIGADADVDRVELRDVVGRLEAIRGRSMEQVETGGWSELPRQPIHGDWHPGNVLFTPEKPTRSRPGTVRAIVDFDASRVEPRLVDLANGLLHFAMRSDRSTSPADWPASLSPRRMIAFTRGWRSVVGDVTEAEAVILPSLMLECLVAESVVPVAKTGRFAVVPGLPFLGMVARKAAWIEAAEAPIRELLVP
ncbi:MAG: phosphotransferase enzyme family protein [Planctomycetota bacterium]